MQERTEFFMSDSASSPSPSRAGFWRRFSALFIDICLIALVIGLIGLVLFEPTEGRIRVQSMLIDIGVCSKVDPNQVVLPTPAPFPVTNACQCTKRFFGLVHDRTLTISEVTRSGSVTYTRSLTFPVDADGRVTQAFYVDFLWLILFPAYLLLLEWRFGRTLGKHLVHIRVRSLDTGPVAFVQAAKRTAIRFLPSPLWLLLFAVPWSFNAYILLCLIIAGVGLVIAVNFALKTRRRELPWDDRWAATEVVHDR
jgi:uncharacterized RDD family membrane protein YckC